MESLIFPHPVSIEYNQYIIEILQLFYFEYVCMVFEKKI